MCKIPDVLLQEWLKLLVKFCEEHIRQQSLLKEVCLSLSFRVQVRLFNAYGNRWKIVWLSFVRWSEHFSEIALTLKFEERKLTFNELTSRG